LSLSQHLKDLLTQKDPDFYQTQGFREQLDEGRSLVERLVCKLSAGEVATGPDISELLQGLQFTGHSASLFSKLILSHLSWSGVKISLVWLGR
jgi:hypothetical protein